MRIRIPAIALLLLLFGSLSSAQQKEENKLVQFHMALLKKSATLATIKEPTKHPAIKQHMAYFWSLMESGKAVIGGPTFDETDLAGIYILRAASAEEAKSWTDDDPAVK